MEPCEFCRRPDRPAQWRLAFYPITTGPPIRDRPVSLGTYWALLCHRCAGRFALALSGDLEAMEMLDQELGPTSTESDSVAPTASPGEP